MWSEDEIHMFLKCTCLYDMESSYLQAKNYNCLYSTLCVYVKQNLTKQKWYRNKIFYEYFIIYLTVTN